MATYKDPGTRPEHLNCCEEVDTGTTPTNCIEKWEKEKEQVKNEMTEKYAIYSQAYSQYI
jgi:hypothetical protein